MSFIPPPDDNTSEHRSADADAARRIQEQQKAFADAEKTRLLEENRKREEELRAEARRRAGESSQGR